jgi:hypothetical protein
VFVVPYTNKSLACLWLIILGLFAVTAADVVARSWLPLLLLVGLAAPTLILRSNEPVAVSRDRAAVRGSAPTRLLVVHDRQVWSDADRR